MKKLVIIFLIGVILFPSSKSMHNTVLPFFKNHKLLTSGIFLIGSIYLIKKISDYTPAAEPNIHIHRKTNSSNPFVVSKPPAVSNHPQDERKEVEGDITYLFAHGLADTHKQAYWYTRSEEDDQKPYIMQKSFITYDYPDVSYNFWRVNRGQTSLAQENEVDRLALVFNQECCNKPTILCGLSRGASTIINFMALHNPENVKALVLESPFDSVDSIIQNKLDQCGISNSSKAIECGHALMSFIFGKYNKDGIKPSNNLDKLNKELPILIVCSQEDTLVPASASIAVYNTLKKAGHTKVHLCILPGGKHAKIISHPENGKLYAQATHAFYAHYNLPHDPLLAQKGSSLLEI